MADVTVEVYVDINSIVNNITPVADGDYGVNVNYKDFGDGDSSLINYIQYSLDGGTTKVAGEGFSFDANHGDNVVFQLHDSSTQNAAQHTSLHWFGGAVPVTGDADLLTDPIINPDTTLTTTANSKGTENFYLNFTFSNNGTLSAIIWDPEVIVGGN